MVKKEYLLYAAIAALVTFIAIRFRHYYYQRYHENHDKYLITCDKDHKCPDMDMFGFKFSAALALLTFNTFLLLYIIFTR